MARVRHRWVWAVPLVASAGCNALNEEAVYVDLGKVPNLRAEPTTKLPPKSTISDLAIPAAAPEPELSLPPLRQARAATQSNGFDTQAEAGQRAILKALEEQLRSAYAREYERFALQERRRFGFPEKKGADQVASELRASFEKLVKNQSRHVFQVALSAGWRDPDPNDTRPADPAAGPLTARLKADLAAHRIAIQRHEQTFAQESAALLAKAQGIAENERKQLATKLADYAQEMNERAIRDSIDPLASTRKPIQLRIRDRYQVDLPAVPPLVRPPDQPVSQVDVRVNSPDTRAPGPPWKALVRDQLKIWLAVRKYRLVSSPKAGRDATKEFSEWIRAHEVGP